MQDADTAIDRISSSVAPVAERYGIRRMFLFGSRSRGDHTDGSDHDFCIEVGRELSMIDLSNLRLDLMDVLGTEVDIVCDDAASDDFLKIVAADRRLVYEI